jgi:hypothetical protein
MIIDSLANIGAHSLLIQPLPRVRGPDYRQYVLRENQSKSEFYDSRNVLK